MVAEMVAEESTKELDDILDEVVNLAETMQAKKFIVDNMVADGGETGDETDYETQATDELELETELPKESTQPQAGITPVAEEAELELDALSNAEDENMAALAKEGLASNTEDLSQTATGNDALVQDTDKSLAEVSKTCEEKTSDAVEDKTASGKMSVEKAATNARSSGDLSVDQELESEADKVAAQAVEATTPHGLDDQMATLIGKKIEATVTPLIEERLSAVVERIVAEKFNRICSSIR
jgi:hypothetical protein